jgi:hypothetical protein
VRFHYFAGMNIQYAVAVSPPEPVIEKVDELKSLLEERIGRYGSRKAKAHVSFNAFYATGVQLLRIEKYILDFCSIQVPFGAVFNSLAFYPHGENKNTLYLAPDAHSKKALLTMMKNFHKQVPPCEIKKMTDPHLVLGRELTTEQLEKAQGLLKDRVMDLRFTVNELVLRERKEGPGQFTIKERFPFGGMSLF